MKTIQIFLLMAFFMNGSFTTHAQFDRLKQRIQDKIERKINQKVDQKIDETVEEAVDDVFEGKAEEKKGQSDKKGTGETGQFDLSRIGMGNVKLTETYTFSASVDWLISSDGQEEPIEMSQLLSTDGNHIGMVMKDGKGQAGQGTIIFDVLKEYLIIIPEGGEQAMLTSTASNEESLDNEIDTQQTDASITTTGRQKQILGYTCQQYIFTSSEGKGEMWVTGDVKFKNHNLFSYMEKMARKKSKTNAVGWKNVEDGFVLEMQSTSNEGTVSKMKAIAINKNTNINFSMSEYQTIDMTGLSGGLMGN